LRSLAPLAPSDVLGRLIEAGALVAAHGMPGADAQLALLRDLADGVRGFRVELGSDLLADPAGWAVRVARAVGP
jgi:hypothetical protein